jgi:protein gp37
MGDSTGISWTNATWNPVRGCSRVSEGCRHCYAERVAARFCDPGQPYAGLIRRGVGGDRLGWSGDVRLVPEHLADPLRWKKPRRIFVNSMSDLFHEKLTNDEIAAVFGVMAACPQHTFQILTKRAKRMREWFAWAADQDCDPHTECHAAALRLDVDDTIHTKSNNATDRPWPLPNVWLGVSVENQDAADERIPDLLQTPAAVRFLSCEPLLDEVRLTHVRPERCETISVLETTEDHARIDWVITGCESGPGARCCDVAWLRSLRDQCAAARVPYFLKQASSAFDVRAGAGSKHKPGGVIELPYLDGVQHAAFPSGTP